MGRASVVYALSDALRFCAAVFPQQLFASEAGMHDAIFRFLLHFASDPKTVSNPYTRAHLVKAMYGFIPTGKVSKNLMFQSVQEERGVACSPLDGKGAGREELVPFLMRFFVDMERTGAGREELVPFLMRFFVDMERTVRP
ncbi:hypothetical protein T484DRAFT_1830811 [Baffinella frigidus]|nr:hypothetical protein T484DRAFT_1830811 [Cryptophyta sp. CCMP2293]